MGKWINTDDLKGEITSRIHFHKYHIDSYKNGDKHTKYETEQYREEIAAVVAYESLLSYIDDFSFTVDEIIKMQGEVV